jgi:hypothetical protein
MYYRLCGKSGNHLIRPVYAFPRAAMTLRFTDNADGRTGLGYSATWKCMPAIPCEHTCSSGCVVEVSRDDDYGYLINAPNYGLYYSHAECSWTVKNTAVHPGCGRFLIEMPLRNT